MVLTSPPPPPSLHYTPLHPVPYLDIPCSTCLYLASPSYSSSSFSSLLSFLYFSFNIFSSLFYSTMQLILPLNSFILFFYLISSSFSSSSPRCAFFSTPITLHFTRWSYPSLLSPLPQFFFICYLTPPSSSCCRFFFTGPLLHRCSFVFFLLELLLGGT